MRSVCAVILLFLMPTLAFAEPRAEFLGASSAELDNPHDLKLSPDGRFLYVSDVDHDRIAVLDPDTLEQIGRFAAGGRTGSHDIDIDALGRAYVAETVPSIITVWDLNGAKAKLVNRISGGFNKPEGILAHPNGRLYVSAAGSNNVVAFEDGRIVAELNGLSAPHDIELAPRGNIWLSDSGNNRMLLLSPDLEIKQQWTGPPYDFQGVRYQDVLPDGTVIVADKNSHRILVISAIGRVLLVLGTGEPGEGPGIFTTPEGVETRGDIVWISDSGNDRVVKYRLTFE